MKREEVEINAGDWRPTGFQQTAPNGTKVGVMATKDGKSFFVRFETPIDGEEPHVTEFCVSETTLATMLVLIARMTGLWMPGVGVIRAQNPAPDSVSEGRA
jgi:hypothetical protein